MVLMYMRITQRVQVNLSHFEILFGRPPLLGVGPSPHPLHSTHQCDDMLHNYLSRSKTHSLKLNQHCYMTSSQETMSSSETWKENTGSKKKVERTLPIAFGNTQLLKLQREIRGYTWVTAGRCQNHTATSDHQYINTPLMINRDSWQHLVNS